MKNLKMNLFIIVSILYFIAFVYYFETDKKIYTWAWLLLAVYNLVRYLQLYIKLQIKKYIKKSIEQREITAEISQDLAV